MGECLICLTSITSASPFGDGEPDPVVTDCGHLFHRVCLRKATDVADRCPICQLEGVRENNYRVFRSESSEIDNLKDELTKIKLEQEVALEKQFKLESEVAVLRSQICQMRKQDELQKEEERKSRSQLIKNILMLRNRLRFETRIREHGARLAVNGEAFEDSRCLNCESIVHISRDCPNHPFVRNEEQTSYEKYYPLGTYKFIARIPFVVAGEIIGAYEDKFNMVFSRNQIQVVFAFMFFDSVCWECGSPFHLKSDCSSANPDPGIKKLAKLMRLENHPYSPEEAEKRLQKFLKYGKKN